MSGILIDNNLSIQLKNVLEPTFPGSIHVSEHDLSDASDNEIWEIAKNSFDAIISKDKDFYFKISIHGPPPKLIWITTGNIRNRELIKLVNSQINLISQFLKSNQSVLKIF